MFHRLMWKDDYTKLKRAGIDEPWLRVEHRSDDCVVAVCKGHKYWRSRGEQAYEPAARFVFVPAEEMGQWRVAARYPVRQKTAHGS